MAGRIADVDGMLMHAVGLEKVEHTDPRTALEEQLKLLGVDHVDMCMSFPDTFSSRITKGCMTE